MVLTSRDMGGEGEGVVVDNAVSTCIDCLSTAFSASLKQPLQPLLSLVGSQPTLSTAVLSIVGHSWRRSFTIPCGLAWAGRK